MRPLPGTNTGGAGGAGRAGKKGSLGASEGSLQCEAFAFNVHSFYRNKGPITGN